MVVYGAKSFGFALELEFELRVSITATCGFAHCTTSRSSPDTLFSAGRSRQPSVVGSFVQFDCGGSSACKTPCRGATDSGRANLQPLTV